MSDRILTRAIIVLVVLLTLAAVFNLWAVLRPSVPSQAPLSFAPAHVTWPEPVCPGDVLDLATVFTIRTPAVIGVNISVIDNATGRVVWVEDTPGRSRDLAESVPFEIAWVVPELAPGAYRRVTGAWGQSLGASSVFFVVEFTVAEDLECASAQ
jgi:hypothetical protein